MKRSRGFWARIGIAIATIVVLLLLGGILVSCVLPISTPTPPTATPTSTPLTVLPTPTETPSEQAKFHYVSSANGSDSNPGSEEKPWKTVQYAVDSANPGDTIYLGNGVYKEQVVIQTSGLPDAPITLTSLPGETAMIEGRKDQSTCNYELESPAISSSGEISYWIIQDLSIQNICSTYTIRLGWFGEAVTSHIILRNNNVKGAIFTVGNYHLFENNIIDVICTFTDNFEDSVGIVIITIFIANFVVISQVVTR